jgi:hypothetical protein
MMSGRDYMNAPVHIRTLFGWTSPVGHLPADVREPLILFSDEYVLGEFRNIGGLPTTFYPFLEGCQYYPLTGPKATPGDGKLVEYLGKWRNRYRSAYPFWLTTDGPIVHVAPNSTVQSQIKIADCCMELFTVAVVATGNFQLEIKEVVTGQLLMNGTITQNNTLGNATLPTVFPFSYVLPPGAILRLTTTDLSGAPNTIFVTMQGRKLFAPLKAIDAAVPVSEESDVGAASDYEHNLVLEKIGAVE